MVGQRVHVIGRLFTLVFRQRSHKKGTKCRQKKNTTTRQLRVVFHAVPRSESAAPRLPVSGWRPVSFHWSKPRTVRRKRPRWQIRTPGMAARPGLLPLLFRPDRHSFRLQVSRWPNRRELPVPGASSKRR